MLPPSMVTLVIEAGGYCIFDKDDTIVFESRFESGNLAAAVKVNPQEYLLLLKNDVNTSGHT